MSIEKTEYLMVGLDITDLYKEMVKEGTFEEFEERINRSGELDVVWDYVGFGEYCYIGKVLRRAGRYEDSEAITFTAINIVDITKDVADKIDKLVKLPYSYRFNSINAIAFTHYS